MAEPRAAWGIDIGQSALKAIKIRGVPGTNQIVAEAFDYIPYPKILSQPDAIPDEIVPQAMETFLGRNQLKGDAVAISVPGQSALARFIQLPPVESSKLHEIVKYEARQQIPFALDDVIWDYQPLGAGAEEGGFLLDAEVGLFAMKKDQIYQQMKPYNDAKVEIELIQIAPLALYNVLSLDELGIRRDSAGEPGEDYYIVLDMGCDNTTLMVSNGYKIWIRNVSIGGNHFTRALTKEMKLSFAKAEHLKCNATKSPDPRAVFQALRPVFNDFVSEIQRSIGYFSSVNRSAKIARVIGLGNGFKLAGLQKFLQQNLQYEVIRPDAYKALSGDSVINSPLFAENVLSFAVPYGLALQGLDLTRIRTSLLPPEITAARRIRKKKPWALATAATLLAGLSLSTIGNAFSYSAVNTSEFKSAEETAKGFGEEVNKLKQEYEGQVSTNASIKAKLDAMTLGRRDLSWMELFNAFIDCLPRDPADAEIPADQVEKKHVISITQFTAERVSERGNWFAGLTDQQKQLMDPKDKETGPSGPGYIVTLVGYHYHHNPEKEEDQGVLYVINHFLKKLQQRTVQPPDFAAPRDVGRLGISHATIVDHSQSVELRSGPEQREIQRPVRPLRPGVGGVRGGVRNPGGFEGGFGTRPGLNPGLDPMGNPMDPENVKELIRTDFVIQFAFNYLTPEERIAADEALAAEAANPSAEGQESGTSEEN